MARGKKRNRPAPVDRSEPLDRSEETLNLMFEEWLVKHDKVNYYHGLEKEKRFGIFKDNARRVDKLNSEGGCRFGLNVFADLTAEEFRRRCCGGGGRCPKNKRTKKKLPESVEVKDPESRDHRVEGSSNPRQDATPPEA